MKKEPINRDNVNQKIIDALKKSEQMLLGKKKKNRQKMVISKNGKIKVIDFGK